MRHNLQARIPVIIFEEGGKVIAYSPAIDLSTYGKSEEQARQRFAEAARIFFDEINKMGTANEVLEELGWRRTSGKREWAPPVYRSCAEQLVEIPVGA